MLGSHEKPAERRVFLLAEICYAVDMSWYWKIIIITLLLIVGAGAQLAWTRDDASSVVRPEIGGTTIPEPNIGDLSDSGYEVVPLPLPKKTPVHKAPNLPSIIATLTPKDDYEKIVYGTLVKAAETLTEDYADYDAWLTVGMSLKQLERYTDARDVFLYVSSLWSTQAVPQGNLGSLYHLYLKDFPKSEAAYKKAIELDPTQVGWYRGLSELYRYSYKQETGTLETLLLQGIEATESPELMSMLAGRYVTLKRFAEAVALYDRAIVQAEKNNEEALVERLIGARAAARAEIK